MKFVLDDKKLRMILIGVGVIIFISVLLILRSRSKYQIPTGAQTAGSAEANFNSSIAACATTLTNAKIAANIADSITTYAAASSAGYTGADIFSTADACIATATNSFITGKCPQILSTYTLSTTGQDKSYSDMITSIRQAYAPRFTDADNGSITFGFGTSTLSSSNVFPEQRLTYSSGSINGTAIDSIATASGATTADITKAYAAYLVKKARDADIAGATRKYIATVCQAYYNVDVGTSSSFTLSDRYKDWDFSSSLVTNANIVTWAKRAGFLTTSGTGTSAAYTTTVSPLYKYLGTTTATNTLPAIRNGDTYANAVQTVKDIDGSTIDSAGAAMAVWKVMRYNGPGSTLVSGAPNGATTYSVPTPI